MKVKEIRATVRQKLFVGNYETVEPEITYVATLDDHDDASTCLKELFALVRKEWSREALTMLVEVIQRRTDPEKRQQTLTLIEGTRKQLKSVIVGD